jgi:hypothetical protein
MQQIMLKTITPLVLAGKLPLLNVKINGENKRFLFDNGVPALILNSKYDNGGGTPLQVFTASGEPQNINSTFVSVFEWEDIRLENQMALIMDLSHFEGDAGMEIHGIAGNSIMAGRDLLVHYSNKQIGLLDIPENPPNLMDMLAPALLGKCQTVPFQMAHHFPLISLRIDKKPLTMAINMGACVNVLNTAHRDYFKQQGLLVNESPAVIRGLGTRKDASAYPLNSAVIGAEGEIPINNMMFAFDDIEMVGASIDGMLGYELFKRASAMIRFNRRELLINVAD